MSWDPSWLDHPAARAGELVRRLPGDAIRTRGRVLRRSAVLVVGVASAALNFPETRLAASAARSTLSNLVAGLVLAPSQPIRLGDRVRVDERLRVVAAEMPGAETAKASA